MSNKSLYKLTKKYPIVVFTKDNCPKCHITKYALTKLKKDWHEINISQHPEWIDVLKADGFQATPVIFTSHESFDGFQLDRLEKL